MKGVKQKTDCWVTFQTLEDFTKHLGVKYTADDVELSARLTAHLGARLDPRVVLRVQKFSGNIQFTTPVRIEANSAGSLSILYAGNRTLSEWERVIKFANNWVRTGKT